MSKKYKITMVVETELTEDNVNDLSYMAANEAYGEITNYIDVDATSVKIEPVE